MTVSGEGKRGFARLKHAYNDSLSLSFLLQIDTVSISGAVIKTRANSGLGGEACLSIWTSSRNSSGRCQKR
jgi:hypothetical protein